MDQARWRRISELFEAALELSSGERTDWLRAQSLSDPTILPEVEGLLAAHERTEGVLDLPVPGPAGPSVADPGDEGTALARRLDQALEGSYRIIRELGRGGMAVVFLAWERKHDRRVVLKVMRPEIAARLSGDRFAREVRLAARLSHPHIVGLIDSGSAEGLLYYVMPHMEGESLRSVLRRKGKLELDESVPLLRDVARALAHAHAEGVVHRDLKPANVLVTGRHAYLLDFGVAKSFEADEGDDPLTRTGDAIGTPRYMAPEQLAGMADANHRVDLYAWGQLAHEMLTGRVRALESADLEGGAVEQRVVSHLESARPEVPADLSSLIGRCLEIRPERRVASAEELLAVLEGVGGDSSSGPIPTVSSRAPGARFLPGILAAAAVVAAAAAAIALRGISAVDRSPVTAAAAGMSSSVLEAPIAVAAFRNETGDPALAVVGRLVGDWISEGLVHAGVGAVVPWPSSLEAAESAARSGGNGEAPDPVSALAAGTGARTVVTGSYYSLADELSFRAEVIDARTGTIVSATGAISAPRDSVESAILAVRDRVMGSIAMATDSRLSSAAGRVSKPPAFPAYRAFDRGLGLYLRQEYTQAVPELLRAWDIDPEFFDAPLLAATNLVNLGTGEGRRRADSLLTSLGGRRGEFSELQDLRWRYLRALLDSEGSAALQAALRAAELTSASRTSYNAAHAAVAVGRPELAVEILERMDPDSGPLKEWAHYWAVLAHARHLVGDFGSELDAAQTMRARFPERRIGGVIEARSLAAAGRSRELDSLLSSMAGLSPSVYWSLGAAMVVAGEELRAHGRQDEGEAMLRRGRAWLEERLREGPGFRQHRYWLASALYDLEEFEAATRMFADLAAEYPERSQYRGLYAVSLARSGHPEAAEGLLDEGFEYALGERTALLARLAAIAGDPARAVSLLSTAFQQGLDGAVWLHAAAWPDLALMTTDSRLNAVLPGARR